MIDRKSLLFDLRRQLKRLEQDLAERAGSVPEMAATLEAEYRAAREAERTGDTLRVWRGGALTQAAVAWLLGCVFVRFAEDNALIETALIAGPGERNARAADRQTLYFRAHPTDSDRDYLIDVFAEVESLPGMEQLYDREHNPVWRYGISGDAARDLLAFWRAVDPDTGALRHDFTDTEWDTRFLGDLYQDLSDDAKKRFALLQTPEFVEEFILDRTLTPALDEFGLADTRLIDPACGSGHFLLGAFPRLLREWFGREPGTPERVLVQRALDGVYGVDVNPFAAAIARFRLLVAALRAARVQRLEEAPNFRIHVAAGDSLLHGRRFGELDLGSGAEQLAAREEFGHAFLAEDLDALNRILGQRYHVVVGNPPYVTVKDKAANRLYRARYSTCHRQYSLAVPFTERFFELALPGEGSERAGYVGLITANSFMKREFGKKLIESFLPRMDLTHVIDTSGAYIPGHGTPTVILLGRHRASVGDAVRTVMGVRGEPSTPRDPSRGQVWSAIVEQVDVANSESDWVSTEDLARGTFSVHPWSIGGGGARHLQDALEKTCTETLGDVSTEIGRTTHTGEDDAFYFSNDRSMIRKLGKHCVPLVTGEDIRDWKLDQTYLSIFPYEGAQPVAWTRIPSSLVQHFWRLRTRLRARRDFGQYIEQRGLKWFEHSMFFRHRYSIPLSIGFAFVATHNHFVFDRGGNVFNRTAPVIKLPADTTDADHLALMYFLNSSVACFWMKQIFHNKGSTVDAHGARQTTDAFENFYEYTGTGLKQFPLPANRPSALAELIDRLATERRAHLPAQLADRFPMTPDELDAHRDTAADLLARMIALQEELDWECYRLYGVIEEDCRYGSRLPTDGLPPATPTDPDPDASSPTAAHDHTPSPAPAPEAPANSDTPNTTADEHSLSEVPAPARVSATPADPDAPDTTNRREPPPPAMTERISEIFGEEDRRHVDPTPADAPPPAAPANPDIPNATAICEHSLSEVPAPTPAPATPAAPDTPDTVNRREPPPLALGERAFEIVMVRRMAAGELETTWFTRHGSTPITELPAHWPADYRVLVERRIELIHSDRFISLLEKPEYKRRWNVEPWHDQEQRALRNWLLDRLESPAYWSEPRLATVRTLAERAATDADFHQVAARYAGHQGVDLALLVAALVEAESVPALPVQRYKPSGLTKRADWERIWELQRREDEIDAEVAATTPRRDTEPEEAYAVRLRAEQQRRKREVLGDLASPPPKYRSADFQKPAWWRLRGALDVPKERFVSFPQMSRDSDPTLLVAWAGWNALELCRAVAAYSAEVTEQDGWPPERLTPLLAVLQENLPWLKQWHNEIDPEYNQRLGDFFGIFLHSQLSELGLTEDDLRSWTPAKSAYR